MDTSQNSFRRGVMSLVILSLLKREDMYGYQLVQETERSSGGKITTQEGSLYPVLYKLVDQGLISDRRYRGASGCPGCTPTWSRQGSGDRGNWHRSMRR